MIKKIKHTLIKYKGPFILLGLILLGLIGLLSFSLISKKSTPQINRIITENYGDDASIYPSKQKFTFTIDNYSIAAQNEKSKTTDHIMYFSNKNNISNEMYINAIDLNFILYFKKEDNWIKKIKSKTISEDNARTVYVESDNEISFNNISNKSFIDTKFEKFENEYIYSGQTNYTTTMALLGNLRQVIFEDDNIDKESLFMNRNQSLLFDFNMTIDKKTQQIKEITFNVNKDSLNNIQNAYNETVKTDYQVDIKDVSIKLENNSFEPLDVYVPVDIEKNSTEYKN